MASGAVRLRAVVAMSVAYEVGERRSIAGAAPHIGLRRGRGRLGGLGASRWRAGAVVLAGLGFP